MSLALSDYNRPGYIPNISRRVRYSDFDLNLRLLKASPQPGSDVNPQGDLVPLTDIDAVKNSIRNICLTNTYERPFQPNFGSRIRQLLFENVNPMTSLALTEELESTIRLYEPRVGDLSVNVTPNIDANAYNVSINFSILNFVRAATLDIIINRLR
jgi:phage baseplate assembly protein W